MPSLAFLEMPLGSSFGPTRPDPCLNDWGESRNLTFNGHLGVKPACHLIKIKFGRNGFEMLYSPEVITAITDAVSPSHL